MSIHYMKAVWKIKGLSPRCRLVFLSIANFSNEHGGCFPKIRTLALMNEIEHRTVQKDIKTLCDKGYLRRTPRKREDGSQSANTYQIVNVNLPADDEETISENTTNRPAESGQDDVPRMSNETHQGCPVERTENDHMGVPYNHHLEPSLINIRYKIKDNPPTPQKSGGNEQVGKTSLSVLNVFSHWQKVFNHPHSKLDTKRKAFIAGALKMGYLESDLLMAVDGCAKTPHNCGINENGQVYDGIHVIFKSADQIDRFIRNCEFPPVNKSKKELEFDNQVDKMAGWADEMRAKMEKRRHG